MAKTPEVKLTVLVEKATGEIEPVSGQYHDTETHEIVVLTGHCEDLG